MVPILHTLFQKTEEEGTHLNLFYEARKILIPKQEGRYKKQHLQTNILTKTGAKLLFKN